MDRAGQVGMGRPLTFVLSNTLDEVAVGGHRRTGTVNVDIDRITICLSRPSVGSDSSVEFAASECRDSATPIFNDYGSLDRSIHLNRCTIALSKHDDGRSTFLQLCGRTGRRNDAGTEGVGSDSDGSAGC